MRAWNIFLALCVGLGAGPHAVAARAMNGCATSAAKLAQTPKFELPPDAKITSKELAFEIDIGSDGHARGLQLDRSSGDGAVDLSVRQTLTAASYLPPQTGCVAFSGGLRLSYALPADAAAPPTPPAKLDQKCTPYVLAFLMPSPRDRKRTGTATVAVELDAAGTQTAPPVLRASTGSPVLDAEALRIARTGQYNFLRGGPCAPQPFTYLLELTFQ
jgi:TonB family protein